MSTKALTKNWGFIFTILTRLSLCCCVLALPAFCKCCNKITHPPPNMIFALSIAVPFFRVLHKLEWLFVSLNGCYFTKHSVLSLLSHCCFFRFNYRSTHHLTTNGFYEFLNWFDERAWYPLGRIVGGTVSLAVFIYCSYFQVL